jgi:hypothetical protein
MIEKYSNELRFCLTPAFITCFNDSTVKVQKSLQLYHMMIDKNKCKHTYFPQGGHGIRWMITVQPIWMNLLEAWLKEMGFVHNTF